MPGPFPPGTRYASDIVPRPCTACEKPTMGRIVATFRDPHNPHTDATFGAALCPGCILPAVA